MNKYFNSFKTFLATFACATFFVAANPALAEEQIFTTIPSPQVAEPDHISTLIDVDRRITQMEQTAELARQMIEKGMTDKAAAAFDFEMIKEEYQELFERLTELDELLPSQNTYEAIVGPSAESFTAMVALNFQRLDAVAMEIKRFERVIEQRKPQRTPSDSMLWDRYFEFTADVDTAKDTTSVFTYQTFELVAILGVFEDAVENGNRVYLNIDYVVQALTSLEVALDDEIAANSELLGRGKRLTYEGDRAGIERLVNATKRAMNELQDALATNRHNAGKVDALFARLEILEMSDWARSQE